MIARLLNVGGRRDKEEETGDINGPLDVFLSPPRCRRRVV